MFKNYLKVAFRNLIKHRFYSLINIMGLSTGLTCFLMITLYVVDEMSYDRFHSDRDQTYRVDFSGDINGSDLTMACIGAPVAQAIRSDLPEVADVTRMKTSGNFLISKHQEKLTFKIEKVASADKNFFAFFDFPLIYGDPATCLDRPNTLVLRKDVAEKVFGSEDPVGQMVTLDNEQTWEVTGVYEMPSNSHIDFQMLRTMESRKSANSKAWFSFHFNTYLKIKEGSDPKLLEAKFPNLIKKYMTSELEEFIDSSIEEFYQAGNTAKFTLFPLKDIYLKSNKRGELGPNGDIKYIYFFSAIALFILILACINFMNLSTARSAGRAREVGIRKVIGAQKSQLVRQFLSEAFLLTLISITLAYLICFLMLPVFNGLADKEIQAIQLFSPTFFVIMFLILLIIGLLAGCYPAFFLARFRPIETLKGKLNLGMKAGGIRSVLVVIQFSVSIIMIIGTTIVFQQLSYIQNKKLGYSKDQVVILHDTWILEDKINTFKQEALQHSSILAGTRSRYLPVNTKGTSDGWFPGAKASKDETHLFRQYLVDHDYIETLKIEMAMGRNFSRDFPSDSSAVIINETAAKKLGWEDPIGKTLSTYQGSDSLYTESYKVIGVAKDFQFYSLKENIEPLTLRINSSYWYFLSFKISSENIAGTLDFLKSKWDQFAPGQPFQYSFLEDEFNELYHNEEKTGEIFGVFAMLAIFIACLGLYGLTAFAAEQRTKEIGVRKVLGASIFSIIALLSKEFLRLVGIAFFISAPISYFFMNSWLQDFKNRTNIDFLIFLLAGALALAIAWVTMSIQSWNAARNNPTESLKSE